LYGSGWRQQQKWDEWTVQFRPSASVRHIHQSQQTRYPNYDNWSRLHTR